ncbi:cytochrome c oxidase subunit II [Candidatus Micrarchaeota archaeon]|nr:cytochrome c oxidase subunit II [Candidatus Micrarchaeota archaeon]
MKLLLISLVAVLLLFGCTSQPQQTTNNSSVNLSNGSGSVVEFQITAKNWDFTPNNITVNKGDRVRFVVTSMDVTHGITIPAFNVNLNIPAGTTKTVEFTADKSGEYPFICSVFCGEGHKNMKGTLTVK